MKVDELTINIKVKVSFPWHERVKLWLADRFYWFRTYWPIMWHIGVRRRSPFMARDIIVRLDARMWKMRQDLMKLRLYGHSDGPEDLHDDALDALAYAMNSTAGSVTRMRSHEKNVDCTIWSDLDGCWIESDESLRHRCCAGLPVNHDSAKT